MTQSEKPLASGPAYHDIQGYMPKRQEFEVEPVNEAEHLIKDLAFYGDDTEQEIRLKLIMLDIYNKKLDRRMECKRFVFERNWLHHFRTQRLNDRKRSRIEKKIVNDTKVFCRLQTADDYDRFVQGLVREEELRERIAQLQQWRYAGCSTLRQGEQYERDKVERLAHLTQSLEAAQERLQFKSMAFNNMSRRLEQQQQQYQLSQTSSSFNIPSSSTSAAAAAASSSSFMSTSIPATSASTASASTASMLPIMPNRILPPVSKPTPPPATGRKPANPLDISKSDGVDLLTPEERVLCSTLRLLPRPYLVIKDTILKEYAKQGFLKRRPTRALIKIDVNKTSRIYDFFIESGWITATKVDPPKESTATPPATATATAPSTST